MNGKFAVQGLTKNFGVNTPQEFKKDNSVYMWLYTTLSSLSNFYKLIEDGSGYTNIMFN